jgi:anti-sigma-K factor RskA
LDPTGDDQIEGLSGAMTDVDDHEEISPNELLAAEYALGVLAGTERTAAAQRVARDRAFAALVAAWQERLAPWTAELQEVAPPPQVWERIAAQLSSARRQRPTFWQSLVFWRGFGIVSAFAAACLAVLLYLSTASQQAALVASIEGNGQRIFVAVIDVKRAAITVVPAAYRPDPTRVPELWLVPPGGKPLPLGVLPSDRPTQIALPATFADAKRDAGLAVSLEPPGGSPTGQPTGPVIGSGKLTNM